MPGGRPKELTPELLEKAHKYIYADGVPAAWKDVMGMAVPTIENFALYLGIHRDTVYAWENENEEFSDIVEAIRQDQASMLVSKGLTGEYNASIAKLILSSKHNYVEKTATDLTTKDQPIQPVSHELVQEFNDYIKEKTKAE